MDHIARGCVQSQLVDACTLGDMLQDTKFCNAVVDEMVVFTEATNSIPHVSQIENLWGKLLHSSKMAKLLVDYFAADHDPNTFVRNAARYPPGFVLEIAKSCVLEQKMPVNDRKHRHRPKCFYHEHKDENDKCE